MLPLVPQERTSPGNIRRFVGGLWKIARVLAKGVPEIVVIQHPIVGRFEKRVILALFRRSRKIALIHDLDEVRKPTHAPYGDLAFLEQCQVLIAHNEAMKEFLMCNVPGIKIIVLGVFDFLIEASKFRELPASQTPRDLFVVGNLHPRKATYLYKISDVLEPIKAFGPNCRLEELPKSVAWQGVIGAEGLPYSEVSGFGLIWDGDSPDRLEGVWGEYLAFNAPHKLSLYVVLGLPVIIPRGAGMASFVVEHGIGFVVDTIAEATARVQSCSAEEWHSYCEAVRRLRSKLIAGEFTSRALSAAIEASRAASNPYRVVAPESARQPLA
jgi:hypothetical protein